MWNQFSTARLTDSVTGNDKNEISINFASSRKPTNTNTIKYEQ